MNKPSWNDAPEWATVLLVNKGDKGFYAFAEAHEDHVKFQRACDDVIMPWLIKGMWEIVEYRQVNPKTEWKVGDEFTFGEGGGHKRTITYIGEDLVCYMLGDMELSVNKEEFLRDAIHHVEKSSMQQDFEKWYKDKYGPLVWNPVMKLYEEYDPNLAWESWQEATHRHMFN